MSAAVYPDYKDSGFDWLGAVPAHWELSKIKYNATFSGGGTPSRDNPSFWGGEIPWVSPKDMKTAVISDAEERITATGLASSATNLVQAGAALIVVRSGILRHTVPVAINSVEVALNQDMKALRFDPHRCLPLFFFYWVQGLNDRLLLVWAKQGATVESIEHAYLADSPFPLPPLPEQATIAAFLDRETAKIDELVEEQRRLIALLKEKRQAVISHAVTKGLDPNAPMKDSGVEWLGEVPAHWQVVPLKTAIAYQEGPGIMADDFRDEGVPLVRVAGVRGRWVTLDGCNFLNEEKVARRWAHFQLNEGDLVISASASMGTVSEVGQDAVGAIPYTGLIRLTPRAKITRDFIRALTASSLFFVQIDLLKAGAMIQHFGPSHLGQMVITLPPIAEQLEITNSLSSALDELNALFEDVEGGIALLQERRAALISAAVTGKIDVRSLVTGTTAQEAA